MSKAGAGRWSYQRYDSAEELRILDELQRLVSIKHNYFMAMMKIKERYWQGRHLIRCCSIDSPLGRLLQQPDRVIPQDRKEQLRKVCSDIDLFRLLLRIDELEPKPEIGNHEITKDTKWERASARDRDRKVVCLRHHLREPTGPAAHVNAELGCFALSRPVLGVFHEKGAFSSTSFGLLTG